MDQNNNKNIDQKPFLLLPDKGLQKEHREKDA
jgi:hypothetical protein